MGNDNSERQKLVESLNEAMRRQSTWTVMFHNGIAEQVGLNITDHKCLDILYYRGPITAGQLAEITGVVDRLEKAGFVRREHDPDDRRRVIIRPIIEKSEQDLGPLFEHFLQRYTPLLEKYKDEELQLILRFIQEGTFILQNEVDWLRKKQQLNESP
jgi:DNA-binding MarR family transcriptional regulator